MDLFRNIMRTGQGFKNYNFREYILRRAREDFKANENINDPQQLNKLYDEGNQYLELLKRQQII